jgi:hypothetical protein
MPTTRCYYYGLYSWTQTPSSLWVCFYCVNFSAQGTYVLRVREA